MSEKFGRQEGKGHAGARPGRRRPRRRMPPHKGELNDEEERQPSSGHCWVRAAVGPDYERPRSNRRPTYRMDYPRAAEVANTKWWEQFGDPALNQLIERRSSATSTSRRPRRTSTASSARCAPRARSSSRSSATAPTRATTARAASASRRSVRRRQYLFPLPGLTQRRLADRPVRPRAAPERGGAGAGLRERAGAARRRSCRSSAPPRWPTSACARSTASSRSRAAPRTTMLETRKLFELRLPAAA